MLNEKIKIINVNSDYLKKQRNRIIELMIDSCEISFPNEKTNLHDINKRYLSMINYVDAQEGSVLVAIINDELIGYLWYFMISHKRIHINQIVIVENIRGYGIGTQLMERLNEEAKRLKIDQIELNVSTVNEKAINFYLDQSFIAERILMKRDLSV